MEKLGRVKNPLTIIALFAGFVEIGATIVLPLIDPALQDRFLWFLMVFPALLVVLFFATLLFRPRVLYAPSDFSNEDNFMRALEKGIGKSQRIADLEEVTSKIRAEIDSTPLFIHARLPFVGRALLTHLHTSKLLKVAEFAKTMEHLCTKKDLESIIAGIEREQGWVQSDGETVTLTPRGTDALNSYIEITIPRFM